MGEDVRKVAINLRSNDSSLFLREHPVTFHGGTPDPVDRAGHRYVFTHTVEGGYAGGSMIYVFRAP